MKLSRLLLLLPSILLFTGLAHADAGMTPQAVSGATANSAKSSEAPCPVHVVFETSKGDIVFEVHPEWSPLGAQHFLDLVNAGFYDGAPWFRVIDNWVAQCGISVDPDLNRQYLEATIQDEPVMQSNTRGYVAYGMSGEPNSRSSHIYINFADNSRLDAKGFDPFAVVSQGLDVADRLYRIPDKAFEAAGLDQDAMATEAGMDKFWNAFPDADYICSAYVVCE